jgi:acetylornithine deacetylase/succinyl-diaminopimelate desuccinylase-like protein
VTIGLESAVSIGLELLCSLVRIETTPAAGRETEAARLLHEYARRHGLDGRVHEPVGGRGSFTAVIQGASAEGVLLHSHLDVAPVEDPGAWLLPPFAGARAHGAIWGRGAVDLKGLTAAHFAVMLLLRGRRLKRSLVMAAVADEESAGAYGTAWLLRNCPEVASCSIALGEGGGWLLDLGSQRLMTVQTGEKGVARFTARRTGRGRALPARLTVPAPVTKSAASLVSRLTGIPESLAARLPAAANQRLGAMGQRGAPHRVDLQGMLFHDCQVTSEHAGQVELVCHPVPGAPALAVVAQACARLGLELLEVKPPVIDGFESTLSGAAPAVIERAAGLRLAPIFTGGPSDNHWLRRAGMQVLGLFPGVGAEEVVRIHKPNERLTISSFETAVGILARIAGELLCGSDLARSQESPDRPAVLLSP